MHKLAIHKVCLRLCVASATKISAFQVLSSLKRENIRSGKMKSTGNTCCISEHFHEVGADIFLFKPCVFLSQLAFREEKGSYKGIEETAAVKVIQVQ